MKNENLQKFLAVFAVFVSVGAMVLSFPELRDEMHSRTTMLFAIGASGYAAIISIYFSRIKQRRLRHRRIFIIYNHKDMNSAHELVKKLRDAGYNPWWDQEEIVPGQRIVDSVSNGLLSSAVALLLVSKNLDYEKGILAVELKTALATMRSKDESFSPVIPIRLDDSEVPSMLAGVQWLDFKEEGDFERLDKSLKLVLGA